MYEDNTAVIKQTFPNLSFPSSPLPLHELHCLSHRKTSCGDQDEWHYMVAVHINIHNMNAEDLKINMWLKMSKQSAAIAVFNIEIIIVIPLKIRALLC